MVKRLAIIPARAGSQRIKNKNMKKFFNKPLISYTLRAAKRSNLFDTIHVSTNSKEIFNYTNIYASLLFLNYYQILECSLSVLLKVFVLHQLIILNRFY